MAETSYPIAYLVKRVRLQVRHRFDQVLAEHDITAASFEALYLLVHGGPGSSTELARRASVTPQTMHRQLRSMVAKGLVRPIDGPGRAIAMELTDAGWSVFEAAEKDVDAIDAHMLRGLNPDEVRELHRLLKHCEAKLADPQDQ